MSMMSEVSWSLIGSNVLNLCKISNMMSCLSMEEFVPWAFWWSFKATLQKQDIFVINKLVFSYPLGLYHGSSIKNRKLDQTCLVQLTFYLFKYSVILEGISVSIHCSVKGGNCFGGGQPLATTQCLGRF